MTLHWWMHWFWVTALLTLHGSEGVRAAPQSNETENMTHPGFESHNSERESRAMNTPKPSLMTTHLHNNKTINSTDKEIVNKQTNTTQANKTMEIVHPSISWMAASATDAADLTTLHSTDTTPAASVTRAHLPDAADGVAESKIVTEKPLSLETPSLQSRAPPVERPRVAESRGMESGAIAGIAAAALGVCALAAAAAALLYRRRFLNKPQTLNDKCSNPDSSGYLDDSTVRDNSEEMYSLDNDSFLNSLEAMTIQNYWTDTVKHTKL